MTIVSNNPHLWPEISLERGLSYFEGSWRGSVVTVLTFDDGFVVASLIVVLYDWGAQYKSCITMTLLMCLLYSPALTIGLEVR
jgi:hypothetical protein